MYPVHTYDRGKLDVSKTLDLDALAAQIAGVVRRRMAERLKRKADALVKPPPKMKNHSAQAEDLAAAVKTYGADSPQVKTLTAQRYARFQHTHEAAAIRGSAKEYALLSGQGSPPPRRDPARLPGIEGRMLQASADLRREESAVAFKAFSGQQRARGYEAGGAPRPTFEQELADVDFDTVARRCAVLMLKANSWRATGSARDLASAWARIHFPSPPPESGLAAGTVNSSQSSAAVKAWNSQHASLIADICRIAERIVNDPAERQLLEIR